MKESQNQKPHVIIIGAGFGGLQAAKKLGRKNVRVTVIDRTNYHLFQPLLYQVATAALSPADIAAPGCKSLEDAIESRRRILMACEYAEKIDDEAARKAAMTFVIIGGGPTGVEMAGAIAEISRYTLAKDFRHIDPSRARVILIEGDSRLLSAFPEDLSQSAK